MKIRLAKKIALTPINRLAPKWLAAAFVGGAKMKELLSH